MTTPRIHRACGQPMTEAVFSSTCWPTNYRSQPIWSCGPCNAWEPHEGWKDELPAEWDGQRWTNEEAS